jgi:hypothetical protein
MPENETAAPALFSNARDRAALREEFPEEDSDANETRSI